MTGSDDDDASRATGGGAVGGTLDDLGQVVGELGGQRVLFLTDPDRRHLERATAALAPGQTARVFDGAQVHVPGDTVDAAARALDEAGADTLVTLGGGSATGLGKVLRRDRAGLRFIAVPTTFAGSEQTRIWGMTREGEKQTGRDESARPDRVIYDPELVASLPRTLAVQSLSNALAHPVSALSTGALEPGDAGAAEQAVDAVWSALVELVALPTGAPAPGHQEARRQAQQAAQRAAAQAARILDLGTLGVHHRVAHLLGGRFELPHAALHAVLLVAFLDELAARSPAVFATVRRATRDPDPGGTLHDLLRRVEAPTSLEALALSWAEVDGALAGAELPPEVRAWVERAWLGDRPSARHRREDWGLRRPVVCAGPPLAEARRVVVTLHGRGGAAGRAAREAEILTGHAPDIAVVAPQAPEGVWYPGSYRAPLEDAQDRALEDALGEVDTVLDRVIREAGSSDRVTLFGFSQGACLAIETLARTPRRLAALVALIGARPGPRDAQPALPADALAGLPILLGAPEGDAWVDAEDIAKTAAALEAAGAAVDTLLEPEGPHAPTLLQRIRARELLLGAPTRAGTRGLGAHESEGLPGALPRRQNSPRHAPYGLYPEQVNTTGFAAPRDLNQRAWLYRVRPTAQSGAFSPLDHPTLRADWGESPPEPSLAAWTPLPVPETPTDFVDGLVTLGGAGSPQLRRGFAIHLYAANRSMDRRLFYDADGELLVVPQEGRLTVMTDLGALDAAPGEVLLLPKGMRFSVLLPDGVGKGYVAELFARRFVPPERGPIGANGLTEPRHFRVPQAWLEDRLEPGYRVAAKHGGALFEATQDHSPWDVAAWHGNWVPAVYDLMDFGPAGFTRFDHTDPSVYTVLAAPLDEPGADALAFVVFPPRWDPTEHTFRPPYFHRNVTTEVNGIIREPANPASPFAAGMTFLTPSLTSHGVLARGVERFLSLPEEAANRPHRSRETSLWFQFESALPISLTRWARSGPARIGDWPERWGSYRSHFDPDDRAGQSNT